MEQKLGYYWCVSCWQYIPDSIPQAEDWLLFHKSCILSPFREWNERMDAHYLRGRACVIGAAIREGDKPPEGYGCAVDDLTLLSLAVHDLEEDDEEK